MKLSHLGRGLLICIAVSTITPLYAQDADKTLEAVIKQQQQHLPIMLDPSTRIENVSYENHTVLYKITLDSYQGAPGEQAYYKSYLTQQINSSLCNQTAYLLVLALGNKITYRYASSDAAPITEITLAPGDCKS